MEAEALAALFLVLCKSPLFVAVMITIALVAVIGSALSMWVGAKLAGVERATFGRSVIAGIASSVNAWAIFGAYSVVARSQASLLPLIGLVFTVLAIKTAYQTTFQKALFVWGCNIAAMGVGFVLLLFMLISVVILLS